MNYYIVEPEVPGGLGKDTVMDRSVHPPVVSKLHYQFDGWLGDALVESFPIFIVTEQAKRELQSVGASGSTFDDVMVTTSVEFDERYPNQHLPQFAWLKVTGKPGQHDVGTASDGRLVLSEKVLEVLRRIGLSNALVLPYGI